MRSILLSLFLATGLCAQTAVFPGAVATDSQLMRGVNALQTTLSLGIGPTNTSINVASTAGIVVPSLMTIDGEIIAVCGFQGQNTVTVGKSSCPNVDGRGFDGTTAASHGAGRPASWFVDAWHHNVLRLEIEAIEQALGANLANVIAALPQPANAVYVGPVTGLAAVPTFRALTAADITAVSWSALQGIPSTFTPAPHAPTHQFGGSDPVATATPGANAIPQAGGGGRLAAGWLPLPTLTTIGGVQAVDCTGSNQLVGKINTDGTVTCATASAGGLVSGPGAVTSGFVPQWNGTNSLGTGLAVSATPGNNTIIESDGSGKLAAGWLPNPGASTLGGVQSFASVSHQFLTQISTSGVVSAAQPAFTDISGTVAAGQLPNPGASSLGGVQSFAAVSHQFVTQISTLGVVSAAQPAFTDISGTVAAGQLPNPGASSLGGTQSFASVTHQFLTQISTSGVVSAAQPAFTDISGSLQSSQLPALSGDLTTLGFVATLATVNSGPGSCGDSTHVCQITTNGKGLVTAQTAVGISGSAFGNQTANFVFAGPTTGSPATPTFRALVSADIPNNAANTSGTAGGITGYTIPGSATQIAVFSGAFTNGNCVAMAAGNNLVDAGVTCGGGSGGGTVVSVGLSLPGIFSVSGSPVTTTGTLTASLATQSANLVWAGPTTGSAAAPTFRSLVGADLPNPGASSLGGVQSFASVSHQFLTQISTAGVVSAAQPAFTDISGTVAAAQLPNPSASTLGGIQSYAGVSHQWINAISTSGVPSSTQPAFTDISGLINAAQLPNPTPSTLGGVQSFAAVSHQFLTQISTSGVVSAAQPAIADLSDGNTIVTLAGSQLLTNKRFQNLSLDIAFDPSAITQIYVNDGSTGTANKQFAKLSGVPYTVIKTVAASPPLNDTDALGIVVSGGGTSGSAVVAISGTVTCTFDNAATAGHYFQISSTTAGNCHDAGATLPASGGLAMGFVLDTGAAGDRIVYLRPVNGSSSGSGSVTSVGLSLPGIFSVSGSPVTSTGTLTATFTNESANTVFAGPTTGGATAPTFRTLVAADLPTGYPYANLSGAPTIFYQTLQSNTSAVTQRANLNFGPEFTLTDSVGSNRSTVSLTKTFTGTGTQIATATGTFTSGHVAAWDASGNIIDGGAIGGTGTVTNVGTAGGILLVANASTTPVISPSGNSGGIPYFNSATSWTSSSPLTANLPIFGGGAGAAPFSGTRTGNTTQVATWTGATTASRCVHTDASGNLTIAAGDCGVPFGSLGDYFATGDGLTNAFLPGWTFGSTQMMVFLGGVKQRGGGQDYTVSTNGVYAGTYTSGISATGSAGQTCILTGLNGGGTGATALIALTGTNFINPGSLIITAAGSGYLSPPTLASASTGTATACSGTANITTSVGNTIQFISAPVNGAVVEVIQ